MLLWLLASDQSFCFLAKASASWQQRLVLGAQQRPGDPDSGKSFDCKGRASRLPPKLGPGLRSAAGADPSSQSLRVWHGCAHCTHIVPRSKLRVCLGHRTHNELGFPWLPCASRAAASHAVQPFGCCASVPSRKVLKIPPMVDLNMRKNFFPLRVKEPWPRLPREVVESPSLEIFKTHLDAVLCSLLWVALLGQGVGLGDPQRSLPTPTILRFHDLFLQASSVQHRHPSQLCSSLP